jgi:isopenicillin-N N-acyltransferase-like protein
MTLPLLHLSGTPYQQGLQHGRELKEHIAHNVQVYFERFEREARLLRGEVLAWATRYGEAIAAHSPDYMAGMRGIAEGSGCSLDEVLALNVRYEILYYQFTRNALADGCTSFAVLPEASSNGHLLMGQNWDWIPQVQGAVLHTLEPDGLEMLSFTEAGIFGGKIGLNSAGLGLGVNGLHTTSDDWSRLSPPYHVRCYQILRSQEFEDALQVVNGAPRACSTNFLIAQAPNRVADLEAAPDHARVLGCENGLLVHTNHFLDPAALGVVEPPRPRWSSTYHRLARMRELLDAARPLSIAAIQACLRDHQRYPNSVCCHEDPTLPPGQRYLSVTSAVMDLHTRELYLSDGPPCQGEYQRVALE